MPSGLLGQPVGVIDIRVAEGRAISLQTSRLVIIVRLTLEISRKNEATIKYNFN